MWTIISQLRVILPVSEWVLCFSTKKQQLSDPCDCHKISQRKGGSAAKGPIIGLRVRPISMLVLEMSWLKEHRHRNTNITSLDFNWLSKNEMLNEKLVNFLVNRFMFFPCEKLFWKGRGWGEERNTHVTYHISIFFLLLQHFMISMD